MEYVRFSTIGKVFLGLVVVAFIGGSVMVYAAPESKGAMWLRDRLPYPTVLIGMTGGITFRLFDENTQSVRHFYENQDFGQVGLRVDFSTPDGQKRFLIRKKEVLNKLLEDDAIMRLARDRGMVVTDAEVTQNVDRKLAEYGTKDTVLQNLNRLYGWDLLRFEDRIVKPSLYEEQLTAYFAKEVDASSRAKDKIGQAQEALRNNGAFEDVAKQYSEGRTASDGGDMGWFLLADLDPMLQRSVAKLATGVVSDVIESDLGFHIIRVEETKLEKGQALYHLRQIFTKKVLFADWLGDQMKMMPVYVLDREYQWNKDTARIEFRDAGMRDFEKAMLENPNGDAAFVF